MDVKEKDIGADTSLGTEEGKKDRVSARNKIGAFLKNTCVGALYALCAYFLGGAILPYGAMPLGVAFLSASDRRVFYIYGGSIIRRVSSLNISTAEYTPMSSTRLSSCHADSTSPP